LLMNEIYVNDLQLAATVNDAIKYYNKLKGKRIAPPGGFPFKEHRYVNLVVIQPDRLYMGSLEFDPKKIRDAFIAGRKKAKKAVDLARGGSNVNRKTYSTRHKLLKIR
jgi:hypothetical protein